MMHKGKQYFMEVNTEIFCEQTGSRYLACHDAFNWFSKFVCLIDSSAKEKKLITKKE